MYFLDYLISLAPDGETALFVRQKPILQDGQIQLHADGAIKATWPSFLPNKTLVKEGQAWFGNTGSYIIDRLDKNKPSASKHHVEYVLAMMLDDIGTKSKTPPLAPTWIIETSEGNYQWGYAFSEQPPKGEFCAAVNALAAAGYTDPGANNPVRNFRLPGAVNFKRGNFVARLTEFHPEREYTLEDICAACDVVPGESVSDGPEAIRLTDDGTDDVMAWLSAQGMVYSKVNSEGWMSVHCPNSGEHSDGNSEARYMPANRAFCCYHGHCQGFGSAAFLDWVAANGGPAHTPGLREELLVKAMDAALSKLEPTDDFPDAAEMMIAESDRKQSIRDEKASWYERYAYVQEDDAYFDLETRRELGRSTFNALYRHIGCNSIHNNGKIEASTSYDENRAAKGALALQGITYAAGEPVIVAGTHGNRWVNARPEGRAGDVNLWLAHVERMIPIDFEREHFLNALAYKVQNPNRKINHAILIGGHPGSGKDTMLAPFFWSIGGESKLNCSLVRNEDLNSQWGYALECEVMEIAELRQSEAKDRRALENALKPIIAAPPEYLSINRKGLHPYQALNRVFVVAFSNERAAISIPSDDRRWFCVWSDAGRLPETDALALWQWYQSGAGFAAVADYLAKLNVSAFNPAATPPMTEAKAIMIDQGRSMAESYLIDLISNRLGEFAAGVIASPFFPLCDRLAGGAPSGVKIPPAALLHALREAGWTDCGRIHSREFATKKQIYAAPELAGKSKPELRRLAEDTPQPKLVSVK